LFFFDNQHNVSFMRLKEWREARRLSYDQAAKELNLSNAATVLRYENGTHIPRPAAMRKIFERTAGAVSPADFYYHRLGQAKPAPHKPTAGQRNSSGKLRRPDAAP